MHVAAIPLLVRQHVQDAAFLFVQRGREISGPAFAEDDVGRRDQRIAANLEGLAAAGRTGWEVAKEEATSRSGAGEWFGLAALAFETGHAERLGTALDLALAAGPRGERGLSGAAAWTEPARFGEHVRRWIVSAEPALRRLGVAALSHHRVDPAPRLATLLDDPDPGVRGRAARLAGELGRVDALPRLRERLPSPEERLWPAWAAARLGEQEGTDALLAQVEERPEDPSSGPALDLAVLALGGKAQAVITALLGRPRTHLLALSRVGVLGDRSVLPWLVGRMRDPLTAEAAGAAFRDLFAVDMADTDLFTASPGTLGPGFAELDPAPLPIADRIAAWPGPDPAQPAFVSQRARMLTALREGLAAPRSPLPTWRHRRRFPAWV